MALNEAFEIISWNRFYGLKGRGREKITHNHITCIKKRIHPKKGWIP